MKKHILNIIFLIFPFVSCHSQINLENGLIAYYPFNGNASDVSGNNINGILNGCTFVADRNNVSNAAVKFNGTSDFIRIPNNTALNPTKAISFSVWVKPHSYFTSEYCSKANMIIHKGSYQMLYISPDHCSSRTPKAFSSFVKLSSNTNLGEDSKTLAELNQYYHVVFTYDGSVTKIYINGTLESTSNQNSNTMISDTEDLYIGKLPNSEYYPYILNATIDEIRIYNRAINECEIKELYRPSVSSPSIIKNFRNTDSNPCLKTDLTETKTAKETLNIYPNPNNGTFEIETDGTKGEGYFINSLGQIVEQIAFEDGKSIYNATLSKIGLYTFRIKTQNANKSFKLIVK